MRISLYANDTLYPLAGEAGVSERVHSSAGGFELTPESEVQVATFVRGSNAKPIDRGNLLHVLTFSTSRLFASPAAAQLWCLDYETSYPRSGTLYLDAISTTGTVTRRAMANTVVDPPRMRTIGATVMCDYIARGGAITPQAIYPDLEVTGPLTSNGTTPVTFPTLVYAGDLNGKPCYSDNGLQTGNTHALYWISDGGGAWVLAQLSPSCAWTSASDVATPDLATGWTALGTATGTPVIA